jgi:hypothetical protein
MDILDRLHDRSAQLWKSWKREFLREPQVILFQEEGDAKVREEAQVASDPSPA